VLSYILLLVLLSDGPVIVRLSPLPLSKMSVKTLNFSTQGLSNNITLVLAFGHPDFMGSSSIYVDTFPSTKALFLFYELIIVFTYCCSYLELATIVLLWNAHDP
jgi:hypothetical protein